MSCGGVEADLPAAKAVVDVRVGELAASACTVKGVVPGEGGVVPGEACAISVGVRGILYENADREEL